MESGGAYGAAKAGGTFDLLRFLQRPQVLVRLLSAVSGAGGRRRGGAGPGRSRPAPPVSPGPWRGEAGRGPGSHKPRWRRSFLVLRVRPRRGRGRGRLPLGGQAPRGLPERGPGCGGGARCPAGPGPAGAEGPAAARQAPVMRQQLTGLAAGGTHVFSLIVFSCIIGEGYTNSHDTAQLHCVFHRNEDACRYGIGIGVLGFLACLAFFTIDIYFPQISNATDRKYLVMADLGFSALWTFLWFIGFCFLTNQWAMTLPSEVHVGADSARAAIAFSFFSIFSWGFLITFALQRYRMGLEDFTNSYTDPTPDPSTPYSIYPNVTHDNYQQPPFAQTGETSEGYQPPPAY